MQKVRESGDGRKAVANAIERSCTRKTLLRNEHGVEMFGLELEGLNVGALPQLPAEVDFGHVRRRTAGVEPQPQPAAKRAADRSDVRLARLVPEQLFSEGAASGVSTPALPGNG
ncbi:hypothetical protein [Pseudomonas canadensis]|uniref:hypothetical protein n=1 Tax=Pseudomonas canadensis TaxID=915099 RepID=UPI0030DBB80D